MDRRSKGTRETNKYANEVRGVGLVDWGLRFTVTLVLPK
jgi:hypothetical protein